MHINWLAFFVAFAAVFGFVLFVFSKVKDKLPRSVKDRDLEEFWEKHGPLYLLAMPPSTVQVLTPLDIHDADTLLWDISRQMKQGTSVRVMDRESNCLLRILPPPK